jgi:antitoxin YefM
MNAVSVQTAGERLDALIDEVVASGEPVLITGMESKAVLISEEVWRGIQATLDLVSIPGMHASIRDGMGTAIHELSSEPLW